MGVPDRALRIRNATLFGVVFMVLGLAMMGWDLAHDRPVSQGAGLVVGGAIVFFSAGVCSRVTPRPRIGRILIAAGLLTVVGTLMVAAVQAGLRGVFELQPSMVGLFGGFGIAAVGDVSLDHHEASSYPDPSLVTEPEPDTSVESRPGLPT